MKDVNLISLVDAHSDVESELFKEYLNYYSINFKIEEIEDVKVLITILKNLTQQTILFDKYFVGYSIPQIAKEFDLLRFGQYIVNIELKSIGDLEKIKKQLLRNKYYLSFLNKELYCFTFTSKTKKLFTLDQNDNLIEISYVYLIEILLNQNVENIEDIDRFFNPSNYLVSPFNSTDQFIQGKFFLTVHQERIKNEVLKILDSNTAILLSIKGKAGTGKTLLTYDIAKEVTARQKRVLIIHCGRLNFGHMTLIDKYNWNIISAKFIISTDLLQYDLIVVDEAQRIYPSQLTYIVNKIKTFAGKCIFSYDGQQCLRNWEITNRMDEQIELVISEKSFELTTRIRSNKEIADFINCFFDKKKPIEKRNYPNIEINYFNNYTDAKSFLNYKRLDKWKIINYTPSTRDKLPYEMHKIINEIDNAHTVIGQEYDQVIAVVDEYFYYKAGKLSTKNYGVKPYYHPTKMLFQIVTRTRIKLGIVIVNNKEILQHCLSILSKDRS
ncbi:MAG: DUF2075 domain-containing protein [Bacteroidota bacterium]|nr:DUF2075 domain-containing protein [Bacteroidota bacterium]MDP3146476.1 DUF2075 domain-containing protein [Bacteroidota bacterium]